MQPIHPQGTTREERSSCPLVPMVVHSLDFSAAGISRSSSLVCAYLMWIEGLTAEQAMAALKKARPITQPNAGFQRQLRLWSKMKHSLEGSSNWHQLHQANMREFQHLSLEESQVFRCKTCQNPIFHQDQILNADEFRYVTAMTSDTWNDSHIITPSNWMKSNTAGNGMLHCPTCSDELGTFSWNHSYRLPTFLIKKDAVTSPTPNEIDDIVK
eukprot:TRINITY_DN6024_c0_g2_i2.p1 TRINITY_DN6024_c0_g2~~TRINITY_DN6024_c0_g2_i2.p1  ORF type:complete len:213 (-),score=28.55 TRINITY_DN6024_c0_g2_i2:29-667(-)